MEQKLTGSQEEKVELELEIERFHMTRGRGMTSRGSGCDPGFPRLQENGHGEVEWNLNIQDSASITK